MNPADHPPPRTWRVSPRSNGWRVREDRCSVDDAHFSQRSLAEAYAREAARLNRPSRVLVYSHSGELETEISYDGPSG